jgi:hydroxymethylglutaryl-CoA reductase
VDRSRIPHFYKMSVDERVKAVHERGLLTDSDYQALVSGEHTLKLGAADKMIENVIGVMGLPIGLGLNFLINGKDYVIPMVVEEPSIVAALSAAAKIARSEGGYKTSATDPILIGQIQVVEIPDMERAVEGIQTQKQKIIDLANSFHPRMVARGGGAVDLDVRTYPLPSFDSEMLVVHLHVDTRDAMGANLVNGMCEGVASLIESITEGKVFLRILSNLTDQALARAEVTLSPAQLEGKGYTGEQVRDGIIIASDFAMVDPYRAATHNKGIMNGIDAVALATGNDWRAIEAGAHAFAAQNNSHYSALSRWYQDEDGNLHGELELPLKVGIVGGPLESNPSVAVNLRLLGVESATELAQVMAAAGLAQNFAALRALATDGIQTGHMTLHARTVVKAAGTPAQHFDKVLERLLRSGEIKVWRAKEILEEILASAPGASSKLLEKSDAELGIGYGKVILLGEHSVVYGRHAIAIPIPLRMRAMVEDLEKGVELIIPRWGVEYQLAKPAEQRRSFEKAAGRILDELGLANRGMRIEVFPDVPRGMGLGGSAALAVAIVRALDRHFKLGLDDTEVNRLAYLSEQIAHGQPSGIDNTMATYREPLVYRKDGPLVELLNIPEPMHFVVGMTHTQGLTAKTVGNVRAGRERLPRVYDKIFDDIDSLALQAVSAIQEKRLGDLGELMNINQGLLNALQVSTPELERLIDIARDAGALGAKLTGGGGGGAMLALCEHKDSAGQIKEALERNGYEAFTFCTGDIE